MASPDACKICLAITVAALAIWVLFAMLWGGDVIGDGGADTTVIAKTTVVIRTVNTKTFDVGVRPQWLVEGMDDSILKTTLQACRSKPIKQNRWSIGHRGAPLQFPEHTVESYTAAYDQGAGVMECDVTFTKDRELVCRHAECDLHTTTNILETALASTCEVPFTPASGGQANATARCCASALTLAQFRTLKGKMDAFDVTATTVTEYVQGTVAGRTDAHTARGTLMTHRDSIALFTKLGLHMTPELKDGSMPPDFTRTQFINKAIEEYKEAGVSGDIVYMQSFLLDDIKYIVSNEPTFGPTAVHLIETVPSSADMSAFMNDLVTSGIKYLAPPVRDLVEVRSGALAETELTTAAKGAGLKLIGWSWERSAWYHATVAPLLQTPSELMYFLDFLAEEVGLVGLFSDWPATVTYYANCKLEQYSF
ncbi:hypothetical protein DIPPA_21908 [Diplonema papillatum]|nr:hypothetical protein DIPPA_21908 [Diplonema papillatum]|eukprot:gene9329-14461_t